VRPAVPEAVHQSLAAGFDVEAERAAGRNWLVEHRADRNVDGAQEELEVRTALYLQRVVVVSFSTFKPHYYYYYY